MAVCLVQFERARGGAVLDVHGRVDLVAVDVSVSGSSFAAAFFVAAPSAIDSARDDLSARTIMGRVTRPRIHIILMGEGGGQFMVDFTTKPKVRYTGESHYELVLTPPSGRGHYFPLWRRLDPVWRRLGS